MIDNLDVAVLSRVNELAERHSLRPYDFVATFMPVEDDTGITHHVLAFESPAGGNALREGRFYRMLKDIGIVDDEPVLRGDTATIIDALDNALQVAPRPRLSL